MMTTMEFQDVVRRRRMVRNYAEEPVDPAVVDRMLDNATHAPSAGFSQGWAFLRLDTPDDVQRFWRATTEPGDLDQPDSWLTGMMRAPVVIVPCSNKSAYLSRYAEADKGWTDQDEARWPVPFWHMDAAMASLLILQTAVDAGLGACFFGIPPSHTASFKAEFGVPEEFTPVGVVTVGHRTSDAGALGSAASRPRRGVEDVVHHGHWHTA
jgi:nitroreductase